MKKNLLIFVTALLAIVPAFGHSVWIEPTNDGQLIIRFAEPDGKFEKSPGHLDELDTPVAWSSSATGPAPRPVQKKSDHFSIVGAQAADATQVESRFQVMSAPGKPGRLPFFYARWSPDWKSAQPALILDLVPTDKLGEARLYFRGKPVAGVKATLRTPDEKEQTLTSDESGYLRFGSRQQGQHMLSVAHHREALPGFAGGRAYDQTSHNATLTWIQN